MITIPQLIAAFSIIVAVQSIFATIMLFSMKSSAKTTKDMIDTHTSDEKENDKIVVKGLIDINNNITSLSREVSEFKLSVSDGYAKKIDLITSTQSNEKAHADFWKEIKRLDRWIVAIAVKLDFDLSKVTVNSQ